jgi:hypothetical protein
MRDSRLSSSIPVIASQAKEVLGVDELEAVADRGYYGGEEIPACQQAGITVTLPKPITSGIEAKARFGKQDLSISARKTFIAVRPESNQKQPVNGSQAKSRVINLSVKFVCRPRNKTRD